MPVRAVKPPSGAATSTPTAAPRPTIGTPASPGWQAMSTRVAGTGGAPPGTTRDESAVARRSELNTELERDFERIVAKLEETHYSHADEGVVIGVLRRWALEPTRSKSRYVETGKSEYLDDLLLKLRMKSKDVGIVTTQWTAYYDLIFNHFDRASEVADLIDRYSLVFRNDRGLREMNFGSFFWEEVKEGRVRDQIFAYFRGVGKGAWSGIKGMAVMAKTLFTDPAQFLTMLKNAPAALKGLWERRGELWDSFLSASPEEQAEMIGKVVGEIEVMLASSAAGGAAMKGVEKAAKVGGLVGRTATAVKVAAELPGKAVGLAGRGVAAAGKAVGKIVWNGIRGAAAGARWAALGIFRLAGRVLRGTWSVVEEVVAGATRKAYYFFDEASNAIQRVRAVIARRFVKCTVCHLTDEALAQTTPGRAARLGRLSPRARAWLEELTPLTESQIASLASAGDEVVSAINKFAGAPGFRKVMDDWFKRGTWQEGARFVMKYMDELVPEGTPVAFEQVVERYASGAPLRVADAVVDGLFIEFKSIAPHLGRLGSGLRRQLLKDYYVIGSIVGFRNVRWVFNAEKLALQGLTKELVIEQVGRWLEESLKAFPRATVERAKAALPEVITLG